VTTDSSAADIEVVVDVLTEAFAEDPVMQWVFANEAKRVDNIGTWWSFMLNRQPEGALVLVSEDQTTAAFWHAPKFGSNPAGEVDGERQKGRESGPQTGAEDPLITLVTELVGERLGEVLTYFAQVVGAHLEEPHWYLSAIGTRPAAQGQGSGHLLLQPMLDRCDAEGLPAYLESSNPRNVPFYFRHGFVSVGDLLTPDGSALMTFMRREPK